MVRQEEGQFSSINKLTLEEMKQKIAEIESRGSLSKHALRKLRTLKKKVQVEEGSIDDIKIQKLKSDELELLNNNKETIASPLKKKKIGSFEKSQNGKPNSPKSILTEQLFFEDQVCSTTNENQQEEEKIKKIEKEFYTEDRIGSTSIDTEIDKSEKMNDCEKSEVIKIKKNSKKNYIDVKKQFIKKIEEYDINSDNDQKNNSNEEFKNISIGKKSENNGNKKNIKVDNVDFKDSLNKIQDSNINFTKNKNIEKLNTNKNKSPKLKKLNKNILKSKTIENVGKEESEKEESNSEEHYNNKSDISFEEEIKVNNKKLQKNLKNEKCEGKSFDHKEGEFKANESEVSDSNDSNKSEFDETSLKKEVAINYEISPKNLQNQKKNNKMFEQKFSDKEEGELEENESDSESYEQSDKVAPNLQTNDKLQQKQNENDREENSVKKQRYVLFLGNLAYE